MLKGTVALITGASSGIGEATALVLALSGAKVGIVARRRDKLEALASKIKFLGGECLVLEADITQEKKAIEVVSQAVSELGRLDILVNCAGLMLAGPIVEAPITEWQRMIELNLLGLMYCSHAAINHLLRAANDELRQVADLVNISSIAGRTVNKGIGVYNATKHAVGAFSESLRQEVTGKFVRVSLIEPGSVMTEIGNHCRPEILEQLRSGRGKVPRLQPEDVAQAINYIVTRPRHITINELMIRPTEQ